MDIEVDEDLLRTVASGGQMDYGLWPALSQGIITRLDKIAHNDFPIPNLPPPRQRINPPDQHPQPPLLSSSGPPDTVGDPSSQDADKENAQPKSSTTSPTAADGERDATTAAPLAPGSLPAQIEAMLTEINAVLATFPKYPPHTIQRLAELVIEPRRHYRQLASYLHAVDRVVHVTSGANVYPLPPAVPDVSAMTLLSNGTIANGGGSSSGGSSSPQDPAAAVSWGNTANSAASTIGTDEALGGALLTPIPWLTRRPSPGSASPASSGGGSSNNGPAEIRTESTETIDGPNGVGSIETVSVSVNGIPSMGAAMSHINTAAGPAGRGITQGELLRQEQEQGVVPVNQLVRQTEEAQLHAAALRAAGGAGNGGSDGGNADSPERQQQQQQQQLSPDAAAAAAAATAEDETETPHARGPEEIGVDDLGPQSVTTSFVGGPGVEMQGIDVEAAVGRKAEPPASSSPDAEDSHTEDASSVTMDADTADDDAASETSTTSHAKRDANEELEEGLASKKIKEDEGDVATAGEDADVVKKEEEEVKVEDAEAPKAEPEDEEMKMEEVKEEDEKKPLAEEEEKKTRTAPPAGIE
ncbi:hypothetical protein CkaCkLH20_12342 [Colletotrichum karsti]|uniref:Protein phosphatase 4 core regulatory subunit R2 n=1 Tax=Colletotrichum karsti TaxID=1095194 RepID=A0A9P6LEM4_9PEZI|nr:uncharacterized protein CkaCkLH20_12342 [Colletotrichum karsti]KAF9870256.1 hypothetical protein CkaCkLH20_12342 [Colletotrichum karsti]